MSYTRVELGLFVADALWNLCVLFPVLVIFWSGSWDLVDIYMDTLFPDQPFVSSGMSIVMGGNILIVGYFVLPLLKEFVGPFSRWSPKHVIVSRVCMYVCTIGNVCYWRGVWNTVLTLVGGDILKVTIMTLVAFFLLILLQATVSPIGCPFGIHIDTSPEFYDTYPRFRQQIDKPFLYLLDVLFSIYVMNSLTVVVWAGLMHLGDTLILPHEHILSLAVSLGAGCGTSLIMFALMLPHRAAVNYIAARSRLLAYLFQVTFNIGTTVVVLLLWRGLWGLIKEQLALVPNRLGVDWICHSFGFVGMICLQNGDSWTGLYTCAGDPARGDFCTTEVTTCRVSSTICSFQSNKVAIFFRGIGVDVDSDESFGDWPMEYFIVFYRLKQSEERGRQTLIQSDREGESEVEEEEEEPLLRTARVTHYTATKP